MKAIMMFVLMLNICILPFADVAEVDETAGFIGDKSVGFGLKSSTRDIEFDSGLTLEAKQLLFLLDGEMKINEYTDVYVLLGLGSLELSDFELTYDELPFTVTSGSFDGSSGFAYGGGVRYVMPITFYDAEIVLNPYLIYFASDVSSALGPPLNIDGTLTQTAKWMEYGLKASVSRTFDRLEPYGGIGLTKISGKMEGEETLGALSGTDSKDFSESDLFGVFGGVNYKPSDNLLINGELRFIDETAFTVSARWNL